jgi:hypothetical protein
MGGIRSQEITKCKEGRDEFITELESFFARSVESWW